MDFSIIIPCGLSHNHSLTQKCLESVLNQDYNGSYEIIIIKTMLEDGEKDPFLEEKQSQNPEKIKIHYFKGGQGVSTTGFNREKGVEISRGEYITFLDIDDFLSTKTLTIIKKYSEEEKYDMIFPLNRFEFKTNSIKIKSKQTSGVAGDFFKRSFITQKGVEFPKAVLSEDAFLKLQLVLIAKNIRYIDECIYFYVYNRFSVTNQKQNFLKKSVQQFLDVFDALAASKIFQESVDSFYDSKWPQTLIKGRWFFDDIQITHAQKKKKIVQYLDDNIIWSFSHSIQVNNFNIRLILNYFAQMKKTRLKKGFSQTFKKGIKTYLRAKKKDIVEILKFKKNIFQFLLKNPKILLKIALKKPLYLVLNSKKVKTIELIKKSRRIYVSISRNNPEYKIFLKSAKEIYIEGFYLPAIVDTLEVVKKNIPIHLYLNINDLEYLENIQDATKYYPLDRVKTLTVNKINLEKETTEVQAEYKKLLQKIFVNSSLEIR